MQRIEHRGVFAPQQGILSQGNLQGKGAGFIRTQPGMHRGNLLQAGSILAEGAAGNGQLPAGSPPEHAPEGNAFVFSIRVCL